MTDKRGMRLWRQVSGRASCTIFRPRRSRLSKPWLLPLQRLQLTRGYQHAPGASSARLQPRVVVGFGGYPSFPPLIAAARLKITDDHPRAECGDRAAPTGRWRAVPTRSPSSFPKVERLPPALAAKVIHDRQSGARSVLAARDRPYGPPAADEPFNLLVFGGSQGARFFAELMPEVIEPPAAMRCAAP